MSYEVYMFEVKHHHHLPHKEIIRRNVKLILLAIAVIAISLFIGMLGYKHFEDMSWADAYVNASMILSGMGPVSELKTEHGKIFAGSYALFSGIIFLILVALILARLLRRFFSKFIANNLGSAP